MRRLKDDNRDRMRTESNNFPGALVRGCAVTTGNCRQNNRQEGSLVIHNLFSEELNSSRLHT